MSATYECVLLTQECFTRVLKGHIALATAVFPNKSAGNTAWVSISFFPTLFSLLLHTSLFLSTGSRIDSFARAPLWKVGLDYRHGTGHGVGAFLNVHEG